MASTRTTRTTLLTTILAVLLVLAAAVPARGGPTDDPATAADLAGGWIARHIGPDGSVPGFTGEADVGATIDAALGLAAAGVGAEPFERAVAYVRANFQSYVADDEGDRPGQLGKVALLADTAWLDPRAFGGDGPEHDLAARIQATRTESGDDRGLYGDPNPFASSFLQALALLGLDAAGVAPHQDAIDWLIGQQCPDGGWPGYRPPEDRQAGNCDSMAPDTNSTALAIQALATLDADPAVDALGYLQSIQNDDGGWGYSAGGATDANSTSVAIQAIVAGGEDPTSGRWVTGSGATPASALLGLQLGCAADGPDRGAFAFQPDEDGSLTASDLATYQAAWGAAALPLPFGARQLEAADPFPACPLAVNRVAGPTRIETAAAAAAIAFPNGTDTVLIAHAYGYADALAGAPLAAQLAAPILLSASEALSDAAADAVNELGATRAVLLGGPDALSQQVAQDLRDRTTVEEVDRVGGEDRFHTARLIADRVGGDRAYVAEGADPDPARGWPDTLVAAALAAAEGQPVLLVTTDELPAHTRGALEGRAAATVVGGEVAVSAAVYDEVDATVGDVDRLAGTDRYATALAVSRRARSAGLDPSATWFATGRAFADALAAGPAVAARGEALMLVDGHDPEASAATWAYVREVDHTLDLVRVVGGEAAVDPAVVDRLRQEARAEAR